VLDARLSELARRLDESVARARERVASLGSSSERV
jgi:hypothetical protein